MSNIQTSIICTGIAISLIFAYSLTVDPTDTELHVTNSMFIRIIILMFVSTYITLRFVSSSSSNNMPYFGANQRVDRTWLS